VAAAAAPEQPWDDCRRATHTSELGAHAPKAIEPSPNAPPPHGFPRCDSLLTRLPFWPRARACASSWPWLRRSTSPRGRDIDPGPRRRAPPVGLSFIGLSGLVSGGMLPSNPAFCDLSNAICCCCCCAPPRRYPGTCRTHHHHPSPGHSLTSISALLTRPLAVCASFLPSLCALCVGLVRRIERPILTQPARHVIVNIYL